MTLMHYQDFQENRVRYMCNFAVEPKPEFVTSIARLVSCKNCLKYMRRRGISPTEGSFIQDKEPCQETSCGFKCSLHIGHEGNHKSIYDRDGKYVKVAAEWHQKSKSQGWSPASLWAWRQIRMWENANKNISEKIERLQQNRVSPFRLVLLRRDRSSNNKHKHLSVIL